MTSLALSFNDVNFTPVEQNGQAYLTSSELATALGYADTRSVTKIYNRYADEFTSNMTKIIETTEVVNLSTSNLIRKVRIFSLRGCHLIAMFSKTAIAKQFRKWVLDILDREVVTQQVNSRQVITPEQKDTLHKIIDHKVNGNQGLRAQVWIRHNRHFKINSYHELLAIHFEDAVKYLLEMEVKAKQEVKLISMQPYEDKNVQLLMWYVPILAKYIKNEIYPALISIQSGYSGQLIGLTQEIVGYANSLNRQALDNGMKHLNHVGSQPVHTIQWYLEG